MLYAPLEESRRVEVTERRTRTGWARVVRKLVDEDYPDKERIVLVMDNLNTQHPASLYEAFEPAEAQRIAQRLEIHYTPKHGSWLNPVLSLPKGWLSLSWRCWPGSAWTAGFLIRSCWAKRPGPGRTNGTGRQSGRTGVSPPRTRASGSSPFTPHFNLVDLLGPVHTSAMLRR